MKLAILRFMDGRRIPCEVLDGPKELQRKWVDEFGIRWKGPKDCVRVMYKDARGQTQNRWVSLKRIVKRNDGSWVEPEVTV